MRPQRRSILHLVLLSGTAFLLTGCLAPRLTEYTTEVGDSYNLSSSELQRMQFYNSHTIILTIEQERREAPGPKKRRRQKLDTRYLDQVMIERRTPGLVVTVGDKWLDVSFEPGRWLRFSLLPSGRYVLKDKTVLYGGQRYTVECIARRSRDCKASLLIRHKLKPKTIIQSQKVRGLKPQ